MLYDTSDSDDDPKATLTGMPGMDYSNMIIPGAGYPPEVNSHGKASTKTENKLSAKRPRSGVVWTAQFDQYLRDAVESLGTSSWDEVCLSVHSKILSSQSLDNISPLLPSIGECEKRWKVINPESKNYPPWSEEEKALLEQLVERAQLGEDDTYAKTITIGKTGERVRTVSWVQIAARLKRSSDDVWHMWSGIRTSRFKRGAFTDEEDTLIMQRVIQWEATPPELRTHAGLWVALEREINREDKRISERYRNILSKRILNSDQDPVAISHLSNSLIPPPLPPITSGAGHLLLGQTGLERRDGEADMGNMLLSTLPKQSSNSNKSSKIELLSNNLLDYPLLLPTNPTPPTSNKKKRSLQPSEIPVFPESVRWNSDMDSKLLEGMASHGNDWNAIADLVNTAPRDRSGRGMVDATKCRGRWYRVLRSKNTMESVVNMVKDEGDGDEHPL